MSSSLPTFAELEAEVPSDTSPLDVADGWFNSFSKAVHDKDYDGIVSLFIADGRWRDLLALTWDFRTFPGPESIHKFLSDRLALNGVSNLRLDSGNPPVLVRPYPDLAWVQAFFEFETNVGRCNGVFRLVYLPSGLWRCYTLLTNLEALLGHEERIGPNRDFLPNHGLWLDKRRREVEFEDSQPIVLVVGAGQAGLGIAARLKMLDVPTLVLDRNNRIGDQWRNRYDALSLHDPVWRDHLPYLPFPETWPMFTPGLKLAEWLESYAHHLELSVWTSSTINDPVWNQSKKQWTVKVVRKDFSDRVFTPKHIVWAVGTRGATVNIPKIAGAEDFKGRIIHSSEHRTAQGSAGKKVIVVGCGVSGHDVSQDFVRHGADVTMVQRGSTYVMTVKNAIPAMYRQLYWADSPPTEVADLIANSIPNEVGKLMATRLTETIAELDRETLDGLKKRGFKLNFGEDGSGLFLLALRRAGGSYLDVGASQLIIDGKIKLKNDSLIERFTFDGLKFADGSQLSADVVVLATGLGDPKEEIRKEFGQEFASAVKSDWTVQSDYELQALWRHSGREGFWVAMGNLPMCRFYSKLLALQIKANEEGLFGTRYSDGY